MWVGVCELVRRGWGGWGWGWLWGWWVWGVWRRVGHGGSLLWSKGGIFTRRNGLLLLQLARDVFCEHETL